MEHFFNRLKKDFEDKEYAHSYMESHAVSRLAAQFHALRKQRGWSQEELSAKTGIAQETISKIESANFNSLTMKTLQKFSKAFDVNLFIAFEPFSRGILDVANLRREQLEVKSRAEDLWTCFGEQTTFVRRGGAWTAVPHLRVVYTQPSAKPLNPAKGSWQSLGSPQKLAVL